MNIFTNAIIDEKFYDKVSVSIDEKQHLVKNGDLFFTTSSETPEEVGMCSVYLGNDERLYLNSFCFGYRLTGNNVINPIYFSYYFRSHIGRTLMNTLAQGATRFNLSKTNLLKEYIILPPVQEQEKIAKILSTWDKGIANAQNLIKQLKLRKKGLGQQLLSGKNRLSGFSDKWEKYQIGDIATQYSVKNVNDDIIEVLSCTKYDGLVRSLDYFGRKVFGDDLSKYKIVPRGYFAYATNHIEEGSIGYQDLMDKGLVSPMYTAFKTNKKVYDSFLFRLLKTDRMIYNYQSNMSGSIARRGGLRWNVFETIIIEIPSYDEQVAITKLFDKLDKEISHRELYLISLQSQKKGLMQQLLTGKTRVTVN
jgi:type I restriction enzyme S subunit